MQQAARERQLTGMGDRTISARSNSPDPASSTCGAETTCIDRLRINPPAGSVLDNVRCEPLCTKMCPPSQKEAFPP